MARPTAPAPTTCVGCERQDVGGGGGTYYVGEIGGGARGRGEAAVDMLLPEPILQQRGEHVAGNEADGPRKLVAFQDIMA